jgi:1-acyl-sn-glycerol-3-phosphate acyltransferase
LPQGRVAGPLVVVANHTAGVDPVLLQAVVPFEIRWLMALDMRHPTGEWLWQLTRIIFVSRAAPSPAGTREAIQHLRGGGVLGVFPEGGIERPRGTVKPFLPGVGFLIRRTGVPVLPVVIEGTPNTRAAWTSLLRCSRATLTFMRPIDYSKAGLDAAGITDDLRRRYVEWIENPAAQTLAITEPEPQPAELRRRRA